MTVTAVAGRERTAGTAERHGTTTRGILPIPTPAVVRAKMAKSASQASVTLPLMLERFPLDILVRIICSFDHITQARSYIDANPALTAAFLTHKATIYKVLVPRDPLFLNYDRLRTNWSLWDAAVRLWETRQRNEHAHHSCHYGGSIWRESGDPISRIQAPPQALYPQLIRQGEAIRYEALAIKAAIQGSSGYTSSDRFGGLRRGPLIWGEFSLHSLMELLYEYYCSHEDPQTTWLAKEDPTLKLISDAPASMGGSNHNPSHLVRNNGWWDTPANYAWVSTADPAINPVVPTLTFHREETSWRLSNVLTPTSYQRSRTESASSNLIEGLPWVTGQLLQTGISGANLGFLLSVVFHICLG
jgi:hypothetical protein